MMNGQSYRFKSHINFFNEQVFYKKMLKNKSGKIVNITSVVGHTGNIGQANYAIKSRNCCNVKSLAIEYAKKILMLIISWIYQYCNDGQD